MNAEASAEALVLFQSSDWRVGRPVPARGVGWPDELREARRREVDSVAERCVLSALEAGADALLIPGDLWEAETVGASAVDAVLDALGAFAPRPVFVVPGERDGGPLGLWYEPRVLAALGVRPWPPNVHVFRGHGWEARPLADRPGVRVVGRGGGASVSDGPGAPVRGSVTILLAHAPELSPDAEGVLRLARDAGATWAALGHRGSSLVVRDADGVPVGGFSGSPAATGFDEAGPRTFLRVTLAPGRAPEALAVPSDDRTLHDLSLGLAGQDGAGAAEAARSLLAERGVGGRDVVRLTVSGRSGGSFSLAGLADALRPAAAHVVVRDAPPVAGDAGSDSTVEGRFLEELGAQMAVAEGRARLVGELALSVGRRALHGRPVGVPPPEDF